MRIGIDLRWLHQALSLKPNDDSLGGIGAYSYSLVEHLLKLDETGQYVLFGSRAYPEELLSRYFKASDRLKLVLLPQTPQITIAPATFGRLINYAYQKVVVGRVIRRQKLNVMHFQEQGAVLIGGPHKTVVSVMDMAGSVYIDRFYKSSLAKSIWRWHIGKLKKADRIIAISESTKQDIVTFAGVTPSNIKVLPLGVPVHLMSMTKDQTEDAAIIAGLGIRGRYFLYVGGVQFNKNIPGLVDAFASLSNIYADITLVMAGETKFWPEELSALKRKIEERRLVDRVLLTGWTTNRQLAALYRKAEALVHPSFYEGFGLTILEAMFYGCPVITSNTSSLPEVLGQAGLLRDPLQPVEFARAMEQVMLDGKLALKLRQAGYRRIQEFNWEETARQTLFIYNRWN